MKYLDYRDYIPSAKNLCTWVLILSLCALGALFLCSSCKSVQRTVEVHDTLIVTHNDTVVSEKIIKDSSSVKEFLSVIERLERDASDIRTIVLSDKGDTIKDYREKVIIKSESKDSVKWDSMMRIMDSNYNMYKTRVDELYRVLKEAQEEKQEPSFFDKTGSYLTGFVFGIVIALIGLLIYIFKKK